MRVFHGNQRTPFSPYDIFRTDLKGAVIWMESVANIGAAKARILHLAERFPAEYLVFHQPSARLVANFNFKRNDALSLSPEPADSASGSA